MPTAVVSPRFRVVIPREIREAVKLEAGKKVQPCRFRNQLEVVPQLGNRVDARLGRRVTP